MHYQVSRSLDPVVQGIVDAAVDALQQVPATNQDRKQFQRSFGQLYVLDTPRWRGVLRAAGARSNAMIEAANDRDLPEVRSLARAAHLPLDGVDDHLQTMLVAREDGQVVGHGGAGVLRGRRSAPVGRCRSGRARQAARPRADRGGAAPGRGARRRTVFLLTTTAERFFPKFGFEPITRDDVPASVQASVEFRSACPASAIVMRKHLG